MLPRSLSLLVLVVAFGSALGVTCRSPVDSYPSWTCSYACCTYSTDYGCCVVVNYGATYWYAWFLLTLLFFVCVCSCIGCGTYRYRRRYYVRNVNIAQPGVAPVVVTSSNTGYQQVGAQPYIPPQPYVPPQQQQSPYSGPQQYGSKPPPYNPY